MGFCLLFRAMDANSRRNSDESAKHKLTSNLWITRSKERYPRVGAQTWPSGGSHKMAIPGYQQVFFQQLPEQLLFFMTDLPFHWIFRKLKGQSHWEPEQCVPSLTPPSSASLPVRVHRRHSGTLNNTALPHSFQAPLSTQWVLRTPQDPP